MNRKRNDLSIKEKNDILEKYDKLPKMSQRCAAQHLKISQPLLCKILKNRTNMEAFLQENKPYERKRNRSGKDPDVDAALTLWFKSVRERDVRIDGHILKEKAEELARKMGRTDFVATDGWLTRWKKREGIIYRRLHGEQKDAEEPAANHWLKTEWPKIVAEYSPEEIFNADETGLYFRALPDHTFLFKNEKTKGNKICKERISILCCVNMKGEKCPLLVIGKSLKPRCFKTVSHLPVEYFANRNAWMTASIFSDWLKKWDSKLTKKIVLLVDNCTAHKVDTRLKNINLIFLPANTTSLIQPCDQGIIRALKGFYRTEMRRRVLTLIDMNENLSVNVLAKKTSLLDALHLVASSWNKITSLTIENCFRHAGLTKNDLIIDADEVKNALLPHDLNEKDFNDWLAIDETLCAHAPMTDEDVCDAVLGRSTLAEKNISDDSESDDDVEIPSNLEMLKALEVLRRGVKAHGDNFNFFYDFEGFISNLVNKNLKQSLLTDHFAKN